MKSFVKVYYEYDCEWLAPGRKVPWRGRGRGYYGPVARVSKDRIR
jgi:hypothetical protein